MLTTWARSFFREFLETVGRFFVRLGLTPNQLTVIGLLLQAVVAAVIAAGYLQLAGMMLVLFSIFDAFDGTVARLTGRVSRFGSFLDSTLDRYAEAFVLFGILVYELGQPQPGTEVLLVYASIVGSLLVSYARAKAESLGIPCKEGLLTRAERVLLLVIGLLLSPYSFWILPNTLTLVLWLLAVLSNFTAVQRIWAVWKATADERQDSSSTGG
jgi:CDP-diacylglycerol--glycerol-3-phosphate 3-phosphatidyltransferase